MKNLKFHLHQKWRRSDTLEKSKFTISFCFAKKLFSWQTVSVTDCTSTSKEIDDDYNLQAIRQHAGVSIKSRYIIYNNLDILHSTVSEHQRTNISVYLHWKLHHCGINVPLEPGLTPELFAQKQTLLGRWVYQQLKWFLTSLQRQPQLIPQWGKQTLLPEASLTSTSAPSHYCSVAVLFS